MLGITGPFATIDCNNPSIPMMKSIIRLGSLSECIVMVVCGCVSPSDDPYDVSGRWLRESDVVCVGTADEWAAQNAFDDESGGDGRLTIAQSSGTLFVTFGDGTPHDAILHGDDVSFVDAQLAGWIAECSECLDEL